MRSAQRASGSERIVSGRLCGTPFRSNQEVAYEGSYQQQDGSTHTVQRLCHRSLCFLVIRMRRDQARVIRRAQSEVPGAGLPACRDACPSGPDIVKFGYRLPNPSGG
jgi:hypothetical protein